MLSKQKLKAIVKKLHTLEHNPSSTHHLNLYEVNTYIIICIRLAILFSLVYTDFYSLSDFFKLNKQKKCVK